MESLILDRGMTTFARVCDTIQHHDLLTCTGSKVHTLPEFWSTELSNSPNNFIIKQCFLEMFFRYEHLYLRELIAIQVGSSISFDHTFNVAANIGYSREDGKWVQQYNALFVVMNDAGKILTWQYTKGITFAEIDMVLKNLKERCQCLSTVYIDDCCKLCNKVQNVFGNDIYVKLDLFHAVQRISRTLVTKCGLCIQDLTHVFRANGDVGKQ